VAQFKSLAVLELAAAAETFALLEVSRCQAVVMEAVFHSAVEVALAPAVATLYLVPQQVEQAVVAM
jgi:hypothetical protein